MSAREPARTPREVLALLREREVKAVDFRFMDFPGQWKHFTVPAEVLDPAKNKELAKLLIPFVNGNWHRYNRRAAGKLPEEQSSLQGQRK